MQFFIPQGESMRNKLYTQRMEDEVIRELIDKNLK